MLSRRLKFTIYRELFKAQSTDAAALEAMWRSVPEAERQSPEIALEAARLFNESDAELGRLAAEAIEAALQQSPAGWDDSSLRLLDEYARAQMLSPRDQLERVEAAKGGPPTGPIRAGLLRAAGLICLRQQLWGKSKAYLLESLAADRDASTLLALARLADAIGDEREAASYFKDAAIAFAKTSTSMADSPQLFGAPLNANQTP